MQLKGKSACTGYSIGKIAIYDRTETKVVRKKCKDPEAEIERFEQAIAGGSGPLCRGPGAV